MGKIQSSLAVFDYAKHKLCDLYDSQNDIPGQAYGIRYATNMKDGVKQLTFNIPYMVDKKKNFRWNYLKSEYLIRIIHGNITEWFIATKPVKTKNNSGITGSVTCNGKEAILKTKNIYKEFDDDNGIGTIDMLIDEILSGTGWHRGYTDPMLEEDGVTEKIRSLNSSEKKGALDLIATVCNLFKCYPVYKSDTNTVEFYSYNNRDQVIEGRIGKNMDSLSVTPDSTDIITRLYVEGEYGDNGYVGIDSANPTGLNYILNFDYYREIGVLTEEHEAALTAYIRDISAIKRNIEAKQEIIIDAEDDLNELIGQCVVSVFYATTGFAYPRYTYGDPTGAQKVLAPGDRVLVLQNNGQYRYATIETTAEALIRSGDYGIVKFALPAAGSFGAAEVAVEAKEKQITNLQNKISQTSKADKIAEYNAEIATLRSGIASLYAGTEDSPGLYSMADSMFREGGLLAVLNEEYEIYEQYLVQQDEIEATFIAAMGDLLRDGYWSNTNYIPGQEQHLYDDAVGLMNQLSRPSIGYKFGYIRTNMDEDIPIEDIKLNAIFRIDDDELETDDVLFVTKVTIGIDDETYGSIEVSNKDITLSANDLGSILSRMSQLADLIDQKNTLYDRAAAITKNKTLYTDRLNGQINVLTNQILSTVSNWYTDDQGNIMFLSADGASAMMLSGAGFMISNQKDENNQWIWRSFGTGD